MPSISTLLTALTVSSFLPTSSAKPCPPLGAVLPAPKAPYKSEDVQEAIIMLRAGLEDAASALNASGVSIGVKSLNEDKQLFSFHHTPPLLSGIGTHEVDENTIYRVGSISKMMPALAVLQIDSINLEDSVLEYIPELANGTEDSAINSTPWEDITIRSLINHLSGLATDCKR